MTAVQAIRLESFAAGSPIWNTLLGRSFCNTVFLTPQWLESWWSHFGEGAELRLLSVKAGGETVGIAPLMRRGRVLSFLGDTDLFDYHDILVAQGWEERVYPLLVEAIDRETWHQAQLLSIPQGSPSLSYLPELFRQRGYAVSVEQEDVVPGLSLPSTWDEYLAGLNKKDRHELRRKLRRLEAWGPYRYIVSEPTKVNGDVTQFLSLMAASKEEKAHFLTPQREAFLKQALPAMGQMDAFRLFFLEVGNERVAAAVCFDWGESRLLYNSGFNQDYAHLSVGLLLKAMCIKNAIERGLRYFDFLRGPEPYKYHLGAKDRLLYRISVQRETAH